MSGEESDKSQLGCGRGLEVDADGGERAARG
jgi:hypothetical protein